MICLRCDICGKAFDFGAKTPNHIGFVQVTSTGSMNKATEMDMCPDCYNSIKKVIDNRRKRKDPFEDDLK
jgi:hypothetical protein